MAAGREIGRWDRAGILMEPEGGEVKAERKAKTIAGGGGWGAGMGMIVGKDKRMEWMGGEEEDEGLYA